MTSDDKDPCGRRAPRAKDRPVASLGLGGEEIAILQGARLIFQSLSGCAPDGWMMALARLRSELGEDRGLRSFASLVDLLHAIRRHRRSPFWFNAPGCPGCSAIATEHERRLVVALAALRQKRQAAARLEMMLLCEGHGLEIVMGAMGRLCEDLTPERPARPLAQVTLP